MYVQLVENEDFVTLTPHSSYEHAEKPLPLIPGLIPKTNPREL